MYELITDRFYKEIEAYPDLVIDYCLIKDNQPYRGEASHKKAVLFAMEQISQRWQAIRGVPWYWENEILFAKRISADELLWLPDKPYKQTKYGVTSYNKEIIKQESTGQRLPYWYAFLEPPHGTQFKILPDGRKIEHEYTIEDFQGVNQILFPNGTKDLTVLEWNTDWSDYFNEGHEWWGAACWSVYDHSLERFVIIMASATD